MCEQPTRINLETLHPRRGICFGNRTFELEVSTAHCCGWRRGVVVSGVRRTNEVNARRASLVLGWVTVFGRVYRLGM